MPDSNKSKARDNAAEMVGATPHYVSDAKQLAQDAPVTEEISAALCCTRLLVSSPVPICSRMRSNYVGRLVRFFTGVLCIQCARGNGLGFLWVITDLPILAGAWPDCPLLTVNVDAEDKREI